MRCLFRFEFASKHQLISRFIAASAIVFTAFSIGNRAFATEPAGSMSIARYAHKAATLPDGRVLIAGGHTVSGSITSMTASAEIYDPATRSFSQTGSLATARGEH